MLGSVDRRYCSPDIVDRGLDEERRSGCENRGGLTRRADIASGYNPANLTARRFIPGAGSASERPRRSGMMSLPLFCAGDLDAVQSIAALNLDKTWTAYVNGAPEFVNRG